MTLETAAAIVELPPPPAPYVRLEVISADRYQDIGCWVAPPDEPPHDGPGHDHEGPRIFRRYVSYTLTLTDSLTPVLISEGSDAAL